jgi:hypothetical protein
MSRELSSMLKNFFLIRKNCPPAPAEPIAAQDEKPIDVLVKNEPKQEERNDPRNYGYNWISMIEKAIGAGQFPPNLAFT